MFEVYNQLPRGSIGKNQKMFFWFLGSWWGVRDFHFLLGDSWWSWARFRVSWVQNSQDTFLWPWYTFWWFGQPNWTIGLAVMIVIKLKPEKNNLGYPSIQFWDNFWIKNEAWLSSNYPWANGDYPLVLLEGMGQGRASSDYHWNSTTPRLAYLRLDNPQIQWPINLTTP